MKTFSNLQIHQLESEFTGQLSATKGGGKILARSRKKFRERRQSSKKVLLWVEGSSKLLSSNYLPSLACPFAEREYFPWSVFNKGILLCLGLKSGTCLNHPLPLFFFFFKQCPSAKPELTNLACLDGQKTPKVLSAFCTNAGITCSTTTTAFFMCAGDANSGPCTAWQGLCSLSRLPRSLQSFFFSFE